MILRRDSKIIKNYVTRILLTNTFIYAIFISSFNIERWVKAVIAPI